MTTHAPAPRRRGLIVLSSIAVGFVAIAVACTFPEVSSFTPDGVGETSTTDGGGNGEGGSDSPVGDSADAGPVGANEDVDLEGGSKDATTAGEAAVPIDASGCTSCDCDTDSFDRKEGACDGGGAPGKADCDDTVRAIHPRTTEEFLSDPWPASSKHPIVGDWDCSGATTKQYDYGVGECAALALGCAKQGFIDNPGCGTPSTYVVCTVDGLGCKATKTTRTQGCH